MCLVLACVYVLSVTLPPAWIHDICSPVAALSTTLRTPHPTSPLRGPFVGQYDRAPSSDGAHTPENGEGPTRYGTSEGGREAARLPSEP